MFKLIFIFIIALSGCHVSSLSVTETAIVTEDSSQFQQSSALINEALSEVMTIDVKQIVKYQNLTLRLLAVDDSRCAIGVECIWAGQLVVTLEVSNESAEKIEVKLIRKREPEIANAFGYNLLLLEVVPHPKKGKVIHLSDQIIKLKIVKAEVK
jgi:hypothetical protein